MLVRLLKAWVWLSFATVTLRVALPKLVNVAEPDASPLRVSVGSEVAVVERETLPEPSMDAEPVTAPGVAMAQGRQEECGCSGERLSEPSAWRRWRIWVRCLVGG